MKMSRTYWNKLEDNADAHEVPEEERIQAYAYGKERLPVGPEDKDGMKYKADKCLQAIGFIDLTKIPRMLLSARALTGFR